MKKGDYLPLLGVGPLYVISIMFIIIVGMLLSKFNIINNFQIKDKKYLIIAGIIIIIIIIAVVLWINAVFISKVDSRIVKNELVTSGVFSVVRNIIYTTFLFLCTGIILIYGNIYLFILHVFIIYLSILLKNTEEKWLLNMYGKEYTEYCKRVNRIIPWIPKKKTA